MKNTTQGKPKLLVDSKWLASHIGDDNVVLIDTRPAADYWTGHLKGARHFDPFPFHHTDTTPRGITEFNAQLEWICSALGITGRETVVFYEDQSGMRAARGVWLLEYAGHSKVKMIDGGLKAAAMKLTDKPPRVETTQFKIKPREEALATLPYIIEHLGRADMQIFDVRSDEEYFGERVRARYGGAIAGAIHEDWTAAIGADGKVKPARELREQFTRLGLNPDSEIIPYCQGGYRAAHAYIALRAAGFTNVRNYMGSWAEWGNRNDVPIDHPRRKQ